MRRFPRPGPTALWPPDTAPAGAATLARPSRCAPWREFILSKLGQGLSLKRIHRDLVAHGNANHVNYDNRFNLREFTNDLRRQDLTGVCYDPYSDGTSGEQGSIADLLA